jgi:hypothetical protein
MSISPAYAQEISPTYTQELETELARIHREQIEVMVTGAFILMSANDWKEFERRSIRCREIVALLGRPALAMA